MWWGKKVVVVGRRGQRGTGERQAQGAKVGAKVCVCVWGRCVGWGCVYRCVGGEVCGEQQINCGTGRHGMAEHNTNASKHR